MSAQVREVGEGKGIFIEGSQEGIWRNDLEDGRGGGGRWCHVGEINVVGTTAGSRI